MNTYVPKIDSVSIVNPVVKDFGFRFYHGGQEISSYTNDHSNVFIDGNHWSSAIKSDKLINNNIGDLDLEIQNILENQLEKSYSDVQNDVIIDIISPTSGLAYQEVKKTFSNRSNVKIIKKKGIDALSLIPNNLDIVFLDANHSYSSFKQELSHWYPKIRSGGIISGHNYGQRNLGDVERVVKEVLGNNFLVGQDRVWAHIKD